MNLIAAVDNKWGISKENKLLANLPSDMKYFKDKTIGKTVIMGRRTFESLPNKKGLSNRTNFVISSNNSYVAPDCYVMNSLDEALFYTKDYPSNEVWLIGGASLYNKLYNRCEYIYITKIYADLGADTFIHNFDEDKKFTLIEYSDIIEENSLMYQFVVYKNLEVTYD